MSESPILRSIRRILIANRGEIAVRVIRACRELGISPVAVYSDADIDSLPVTLVDSAIRVGAGPAADSYLNIERIVEAARYLEADAVHPGYGFLSENAAFARALEAAGVIWIGPSPSAMDLLGDKIAAKTRIDAAGVPTVPGYNGDDQSSERLIAEAARIGVPVLIKAASGGGGRGQRIVRDLSVFQAALDEARRESEASFGDSRVLLEKFLERPRHIEFQIFGDVQGNVVSLFERECSVQRRRQKIIEETPSPIMTPELRERMAAAAVAAASAAGYVGAGTVEFLLDTSTPDNPLFYFLEVNTRLQVEHPVTELVTGLDLVKLQIAVAENSPLGFEQSDLTIRGHAMELRIYAEDPATGFLPSIGRIVQWIPPNAPGVRVDSGVRAGSEVSPFYDPLLAKLIVYGKDRAESIARAEAALREFHVLGVRTNIEYLLAILEHPEFRAGNLSVQFLDEHFADWKSSGDVPVEVILAAVVERLAVAKTPIELREGNSDSISPWHSLSKWRNAK